MPQEIQQPVPPFDDTPELATPPTNDMFFGDEVPTGVSAEVPEEIEEVLEMQPSSDEFKNAIMEQLKVQMGAELEDPKKLQAVQQQVSIAVDNVMIEFSNYTVEQKQKRYQSV